MGVIVPHQAQQQSRDTFARRPGRQLGQPGIGLTQRTLPTGQQLDVQIGVVLAQCLDGVDRQAADLGRLHDHGVMLVRFAQQCLETGDVGRLDQAHDALRAVGKVLH
mgnify:CR=1 FL=1